MANNEHRLDSPVIVEKDGNLVITVTFYWAGYLAKSPQNAATCTLQVYHTAIASEDEQVVFEKKSPMKLTDFASHIYTVDFTVPKQNSGKITLDLTLVKSANGAPLAKASYQLGPKLNAPTKIRRNDQAPRMLQALNTAAGLKAKPTTSHKLNDILEHIHAALIDNDAFRKGIASSIDGALSSRRQMSQDKLTAVDEQLSLVITEKLLGLPYQMAGNVYGNCFVPDVNKKARLVHLNNDVFWELMRPNAEEITYPWCTECQQLTTMVNYLRGVDIWALAPGAKGELGAQRASFKVAEAAGGKVVPDKEAQAKLPATLYEDANCPLGPGDFFVFSDEKQRYKDPDDGNKEKIATGPEVASWTDEERAKRKPQPIPAQDPANHPHISCILRVFKRAGNYFFQLMDTGGQPPYDVGFPVYRRTTVGLEGICDGKFSSQIRSESSAAGMAPCIGIGVWPKKYKTEVARLEKAYERALVARPVACARLFLIERATGAVLYATPLLRTYTNDKQQNFSPARLAWSLRNVPHAAEIEPFWSVWAPRGPLARRLIDSRHTSLFDVRSEFAASTGPSKEFNQVVLSKFGYGECQGFLFLQNIVAISPTTADELYAAGTFRFPTDDADPNHYKKFGYVECNKINTVHSAKSWVQHKKYDLNTYAWDQHIYGDRALRTVETKVTSADVSQELKILDGAVEIDNANFAQLKGRWTTKARIKNAGPLPQGKALQTGATPKDVQLAAAKTDTKQSVAITLPASAVAFLKNDKVDVFIELAVPVIDKRYARPDKYDSYPYFRGDFPLKPSNCPGSPKPDECPDFFPDKCPADCAYIVRLSGLKLNGTGKLGSAFSPDVGSYQGTISYVDGEALTVTASASCKATIEIKCGGQTVTTQSGVESPPIKLAVGKNTVDVTATTLNNTKKQYKLTIERATASKEHTLSKLTVAPGKLVQAGGSGAFASGSYKYEVVDTQDGKLGFTPSLTNSLAKLKVNGKPHTPDTEITLAMIGFKAHEVKFEVTAEDGNSSTYEVVYYRGDGNVALKTLRVLVNAKDQELVKQITPDASQKDLDKETYTVDVPDNTTRVRLMAVPEAQTSRVYLNGKQMWGVSNVNLPNAVEGEPALQTVGPTIALVEVEAQNGKRRTYEIQIRRPKDNVTAEE